MGADEQSVQSCDPAATRRRHVGRYEVIGELGRGGMARVYLVRDPSTGRQLALKQLTGVTNTKRAHAAAALFEREYHTLTQLSHPRVIRVYDFGIEADGPYYTMELLDGGDLRERSPLAWRQACELIFDVCSSLALMHSRRLVHRDVSPRNVRCTRDGHAKLIDFGAMAPMGAGAQLVGTAPFVAPEALHGSALDARTDLFSLGCTLYFALTGRLAFPARDFSHLLEVWSEKPVAPSSIALDIPAALDRLVLSLISLEPALRPRSAFEVMQRLATVAGIRREEPLSVSKAYLVTPTLVGRDEPMSVLRERLQRAPHGRGRAFLIAAPAGFGRTRMLDACAIEAKTIGACVLRASTVRADGGDFACASALATQLNEQHPELALEAARTAGVFDLLFDAEDGAANAPSAKPQLALKPLTRPQAQRPALQRALLEWLLAVSTQRLLVVVIDDADRIDDASLALLAALADRIRRKPLVLLASSSMGSAEHTSAGLAALRERARTLELRPLTLDETERLLGSVFGDVPNLALLGARIHAASSGSPRQIMQLAQLLVDRDAVRYEDGSWTLPVQLTASDLPTSSEAAFRMRVAALTPLARRLLEVQALSEYGRFTRDDYAIVAGATDPAGVDTALDQLVSLQLLDGDGQHFALAQRSVAEVVYADLDESEREQRHAALAELYERSGRPPFAVGRQLLLAGAYQRGLDRLIPLLQATRDRAEFASTAGLSVGEIGRVLTQALQVACELERGPYELSEIRRALVILSVADDDALYWLAAPQWRSQLERDSGLTDFRSLPEGGDAQARLTAALTAATQRYNQTAPTERVYPVEHATRLLVHYVAISIAIGARSLDVALLTSLPELLEPFAPLSPLLAAIWQNALATCEAACYRQPQRACARWIKVYEQLGEVEGPDPQLVRSIRNAIAYGVGSAEASMGQQSALRWAEILDRDPMQKVSAMYLRKITCMQQGDLEGAERFRKQAELLSLDASTRQMFTSLLMLELGVHFAALDLTGVKHVAERIEPLAERNRGWLPFRYLAQGHYQRLRGDLEAARQAYERCVDLAEPDVNQPTRSIAAWPMAAAAHIETLLELGRHAEAQTRAERALALCERCQLGATGHEIARTFALTQARLGAHAQAAARLDALLETQRALGVSGLNLGASYEARARIAIWAGDRPAVERFARLAAQQYRHGRGSTLGARYERLMEEARGAGVVVLPDLSPFESTMFGNTEISARALAVSAVARAMLGVEGAAARVLRALELICEARAAHGGHLYLAVDGEPRLVASHQAQPPDAIVERLVTDFWTQQLDDPDTAPAHDGSSAPAYSAQQWTDLQGNPYQPVLVSGRVGAEVVNVGVAVLAPGTGPDDCTTGSHVVAELAAFLVRSGDSTLLRSSG